GLADPETAAEFYTWGGWLPIKPEIVEAPAFQQYLEEHPQFRTFVDMLPSENIEVAPAIPQQSYLMNRIYTMQERVVRGIETPEEALRSLERAYQRELREHRQE